MPQQPTKRYGYKYTKGILPIAARDILEQFLL